MLNISKDALELLNILNNHGYEAFLVGGCIRDALLNKVPNDYDITTNAMPNEIKETFKDYKVVDVSGKCGTIIVYYHHNSYEITPYRLETAYLDHRHPTEVTFSKNLKDDLARRDFTINAFAYHPNTALIDLFDGQTDLNNRIIRCIGEPNKRFQEDALRILRALRFSSKLNFQIENSTKEAIFFNKELLKYISIERIMDEFKTIILSNNAPSLLKEYQAVIEIFLPHFNQKNIEILNKIPEVFYLRLAALLIDSDINLSLLHLDNKTNHEIKTILNYHNISLNLTDYEIKKYLVSLGNDLFLNLLTFITIKNNISSNIINHTKQIYSQLNCLSTNDLKINGNDLIEHGYTGKQIGLKLEELFDLVLQEKLPNEREVLLNHI